MIRAAATFLCLTLAGGPILADPAQRALDAARAIEAATTAMQEAGSGRAQIAALGETIQAYEDGLVALREGLRTAQLEERAQTQRFRAASERLTRLLGVLMATERTDPALAMLHPEGALATARAGMLLGEISPALAREAATLREELEELRALRRARQYGTLALEQGLEAAQTARTRLAQAIADRGPLPQRLGDSEDYLAALARDSETLQDFAADLAGRSAHAEGSPALSFLAARGTLALPVRATLLHGFGASDAAGVTRDGLVLATAPEALVTAPWSATVRYAGPLSGHGQVVIVEPAEAYLMVLSGLDEVLVRTGEILPEGTPLGTMPPAPPGQANSGSRSQTLYFEIRHEGKPIDPEPWFAFSVAGEHDGIGNAGRAQARE